MNFNQQLTTMNKQKHLLIFLVTVLFSSLAAWGQDTDFRQGATIIAAQEGAVTFLGPDGKALPAANTKVNDVLPMGSTLTTGANGKVILLFSNGTVSTLMPNGKLVVSEFVQEAFKAPGGKMSDLKKEPSQSSLSLKLDFGDLVVGTKELSEDSTFDIETPTGTAGIRGTQFQVAQKPNGGPMALDVTESTVAFTPKGAAAPTLVNANQGLDVAAGGALTQRPVNPVVAQTVNVANTGALAVAADVSVNEVSAKVQEAPPAKPKKKQPKEGRPEKEGDGEGTKPGGEEKQPGGEGQGAGRRGGDKPKKPAERLASESRPKVDREQALENNPDAKQVRKVGKLDKRTKRLLEKELSEEQMKRFFEFPEDLQDRVLSENPVVAQRLLEIRPSVANLRTFYSYGPNLRGKLLNVVDNRAVDRFLDHGYDAELASALLSSANVALLNAGASAQAPALDGVPATDSFDGAAALLEVTNASGNDHILPELMELGGGELSFQDIVQGLQANQLLQDSDMSGGFDSSRDFGSGFLDNPFYADAASVFTLAKDDLGLNVTSYGGVAGRSLSLGTGNFDYGPYLDGGVDTVLVSASTQLLASGDITFDTTSTSAGETRVVLMSGGDLKTADGTTLSHALSDLVVTARDDVELLGSSLSAGRRLEVLGHRDVTITNGRLEASEAVRLQAAKKLHLDSVQFSQGLPSIYLQANTVNLRNVDFPNGSMININSLKGALDGKYPNFGAEKFGRVNFLENVKYGGNLLQDRPGFDQHGQNITIGKIPQP